VNYNESALCDDGSCEFDQPAGCTDMEACNYDSLAILDDLSCVYPGCTDMMACNYEEQVGCEDNTLCVFGAGCTDIQACNYDSEAVCDDASCQYDILIDSIQYVDSTGTVVFDDSLLTQGEYEFVYDAANGCDSIVYLLVIDSLAEGCLNVDACNYDPTVGINVDSLCVLPDGCTDMLSCNYNSEAICDDGSCNIRASRRCLYSPIWLTLQKECYLWTPLTLRWEPTCTLQLMIKVAIAL